MASPDLRLVVGFLLLSAAGLPGCLKAQDVVATVPASLVAPPAPAPAAAAQRATAVKLKALQNGDRACYLIVQTPAGERSLEGEFELCPGGSHDASALIGKQVFYTTTRANVLAASCQGNVDCGKSDEVELVTTVKPAP